MIALTIRALKAQELVDDHLLPWTLPQSMCGLALTAHNYQLDVDVCILIYFKRIVSSVRSSNSHPDLLVIQLHQPLFQITPILNIGLSLSEPLQLY